MSRFFHPLDEALGTRSKVQILRVLMEQDAQISGREIARQAGTAPRTAQLALEDLCKLGLVDREESARAHRFSLNRQHALVKHGLEELFTAERRAVDDVFDRLQSICSRISRDRPGTIRSAWLFGSALRGEDTLESDLDLIILTDGMEEDEDLREELVDARREMAQEYGLDLSPVVMSVERLKEMDRAGATLAADLREDARRVFGSSVREVLG